MTSELSAIFKKSLKSNRWEKIDLGPAENYTHDNMVARWVVEKNKWLHVSHNFDEFNQYLFVEITCRGEWCARWCHQRTYSSKRDRAYTTRRSTNYEATFGTLQRLRIVLPSRGCYRTLQWNMVWIFFLRWVSEKERVSTKAWQNDRKKKREGISANSISILFAAAVAVWDVWKTTWDDSEERQIDERMKGETTCDETEGNIIVDWQAAQIEIDKRKR